MILRPCSHHARHSRADACIARSGAQINILGNAHTHYAPVVDTVFTLSMVACVSYERFASHSVDTCTRTRFYDGT